MADYNRSEEHQHTVSPTENHEVASLSLDKKKYGGLAPKKPPLISKDHERAFFDSADWALCKQGAGLYQKSTMAVETLQPKLQRTPHQQLPPRRPACTSGRDSIEIKRDCAEQIIADKCYCWYVNWTKKGKLARKQELNSLNMARSLHI